MSWISTPRFSLAHALSPVSAGICSLAASAKHAGEADPYKGDAPEDIDEDDFDEENTDLSGDNELDEDANR